MSVEKMCRVCLSQCAELTPLWVQLPGESKTLKAAINFIANINIKLEDGLPDKICKTCESVLDLADTFKQRCLESESILEQQAQEKQSDESRLKYEKHHQENSGTYSANPLRELTESADNIYDLPEHKIKIEIEDTEIEEENLDTAEYEVAMEQCFIKEEFSAETITYPDNKETFSCPHCGLTFQTKLSYKVHIFFTHSTFSHRKGAPSLKKPKLENMQPTTAEVRSATEDPAAADTSTATVMGTETDFQKAEKRHIIRETSKDKMKKESTKDTAAVLKLSGTNTDDKVTCTTEKQSECFNNTVIGITGDIPTCDICGYTTASARSLNSHLKAHAATKQYSCDSCLYLTVKLNRFKEHLITHVGDKPYSCNVCNKSFAQRSDLNKHMRTHTGVKPYSCDVCEKKFNENHDLLRHKRTHTGDKPYSCNVCQKKFSLKSHLVQHLRTHTGEKPYSCDECEKKFNQRQTLIVHMRSHTGERPYSCDICDKKFRQKGGLIAHARTHTGNKPYSCDVCQKRFNRRDSLVTHARIHTGDKPYSCDVCERKFSQKGSLVVHVRRTHTARH